MSSGWAERAMIPEHFQSEIRRNPCPATSPVLRWNIQGPCSRAYSSTPSRMRRCVKLAVGRVTSMRGKADVGVDMADSVAYFAAALRLRAIPFANICISIGTEVMLQCRSKS